MYSSLEKTVTFSLCFAFIRINYILEFPPMDFITTQLNKIILTKKKSDQQFILWKNNLFRQNRNYQYRNNMRQKWKSHSSRHFCNKRVPVQIGYLERELSATQSYLIDSHACLLTPPQIYHYIETQARRLRTWNNFFFKKEYSHIELVFSSEW